MFTQPMDLRYPATSTGWPQSSVVEKLSVLGEGRPTGCCGVWGGVGYDLGDACGGVGCWGPQPSLDKWSLIFRESVDSELFMP